jgi:hypothetical protein
VRADAVDLLIRAPRAADREYELIEDQILVMALCICEGKPMRKAEKRNSDEFLRGKNQRGSRIDEQESRGRFDGKALRAGRANNEKLIEKGTAIDGRGATHVRGTEALLHNHFIEAGVKAARGALIRVHKRRSLKKEQAMKTWIHVNICQRR